jgi:hypothetical protein
MIEEYLYKTVSLGSSLRKNNISLTAMGVTACFICLETGTADLASILKPKILISFFSL